jgi:hypothetical protein
MNETEGLGHKLLKETGLTQKPTRPDNPEYFMGIAIAVRERANAELNEHDPLRVEALFHAWPPDGP